MYSTAVKALSQSVCRNENWMNEWYENDKGIDNGMSDDSLWDRIDAVPFVSSSLNELKLQQQQQRLDLR